MTHQADPRPAGGGRHPRRKRLSAIASAHPYAGCLGWLALDRVAFRLALVPATTPAALAAGDQPVDAASTLPGRRAKLDCSNTFSTRFAPAPHALKRHLGVGIFSGSNDANTAGPGPPGVVGVMGSVGPPRQSLGPSLWPSPVRSCLDIRQTPTEGALVGNLAGARHRSHLPAGTATTPTSSIEALRYWRGA